jgi:ATP-dependent helicase HrpB
VRPDFGTGPRHPRTLGPSDLLDRLEQFQHAEAARFHPSLYDHGIDPIAAKQVAKTRDELLHIARRLPIGKERPADDLMLRLPLLAYPDRVCRRRGETDRAAIVGGGGVRLAPESAVTRAPFFIALDARHDARSDTREALVRIASEIEVDWLQQMFPQEIRRETSVIYDASRDRVVGRASIYYRDLLLHEDSNVAINLELAKEALGNVARGQATEIFQSHDAAAAILARVQFLRAVMPEHPWPDFTETLLGDLLAAACGGKRSLQEIRALPLDTLLKNELHWPLDRLLEEHAPEGIAVPTGNIIRLSYHAGPTPVLAVRLQEIFGWADTPRIAGGRVQILMHLLGPNYRPVQITSDLRSFWATTYFQVRKDLRVKYPKHSWPDDPMAAPPVARGRRKF